MGDISLGAYALKQRATARGLHVSTGHAQQLLAALFGHKTLAAFQTSGEPATIADATHLLIDLDLAEDRAGELGLPAEIVTVAAETLAAELSVSVHRRRDDLVVALQREVQNEIVRDAEVNSQMAMTNASLSTVYVYLEGLEDFDFDADDAIEQRLAGQVLLRQDEERVFDGTEIDVEASLCVPRVGKRMFGSPAVRVTHARLRGMNEAPAPLAKEPSVNKRPPFELAIHPDPLPALVVERGPGDQGVGWWVPEVKHTTLAKYISATRKAQAKFKRRVFIDPFCGPGRIQVRGEAATRAGGSMVAWQQSVAADCPFTSVLVGDLNAGRASACEARLRSAGAPVKKFEGPAAITTLEMIEHVPEQALCLAYIDPYNLEFLSFSIIKALAKLKHIDFAVHFSLMDLTRNVDMELDPARDRFSGANPGWRDRLPPDISKANLAAWFFEDWMAQVKKLGFQISHAMPLVEDSGRALYRLVFFSRHRFPDRIWGDVAKGRNLPLFDFME